MSPPRLPAANRLQLSLAWVIAQGDFICAIPGTRRRDHLEENWRAQQVRLRAADLARIREDLPESAVAGERYTPEVMRGWTGRELRMVS